MRMRINHRLLQAILFFLAIFTIATYIIRCGDTSRGRTDHLVPATSKSDINIFDDSNDHDYLGDEHEPPPLAEAPRIRTRGGLKTLDDIECLINDEYTVSCKQEDGEVYVPFTFLREYFEVNGKVVKRNGEERFEWQHSYSKVYYPRGRYDPHGIYMWFENYHVEVRDRVLCISGVEGVPISTQWDSHGHFYPIQIAQFGLSHFSKNLTEKSPSTTLVDGGEKPPLAQWTMSTIGKTRIPLKRVLDEATNRKVT